MHKAAKRSKTMHKHNTINYEIIFSTALGHLLLFIVVISTWFAMKNLTRISQKCQNKSRLSGCPDDGHKVQSVFSFKS